MRGVAKNFQLSLICNILSSSQIFFLWPHPVAGRVLVPWPGVEPVSPALRVQNFNDWTAREVLPSSSITVTYINLTWQCLSPHQFSSVAQSCLDSLQPHGLQHSRLPSLSITNSGSLLKLMSVELVMASNHLILCHPLLLLPSIFPSIRAFSNESALHIKWPKYWYFSLSISPSSEYSELISFRIDFFLSPCCPRDSQEFSNTTVQKHHYFLGAQLSLWSNSHIHTCYWKNHSFD